MEEWLANNYRKGIQTFNKTPKYKRGTRGENKRLHDLGTSLLGILVRGGGVAAVENKDKMVEEGEEAEEGEEGDEEEEDEAVEVPITPAKISGSVGLGYFKLLEKSLEEERMEKDIIRLRISCSQRLKYFNKLLKKAHENGLKEKAMWNKLQLALYVYWSVIQRSNVRLNGT